MNRLYPFILVCLLLGAVAATERPLRIYLPQDIRLDGETATLGHVGILLGDAALVEKAQSISLGTFAMEGQALLIDRHTILSRLASDGIRPGQVQLLGAETVRVGRHEMTVSAECIIACAQRYLERKLSDDKNTEIAVIRTPKAQILSTDGGAVELTVTEDTLQGGGVRKIQVTILQNGSPVGVEHVFFSLRYSVRRVIAAEELLPGTTLTGENVRVETVRSEQPEPDGWTVPYGMVVRQRIAKDAVISDTLLEPRQEPIVIRRRQNVMVRLDNGALFISALGEALDDGHIGELIRVRRGRRPEERIIVCRVIADGTVEPVF